MKADEKSKTLFLNGKEVDSFDLTGDETKDLAAAKKLLAEQDIEDARRRDAPGADCSLGLCGSAP